MKRGLVDLINYKTFEFYGYQWIMHYQDHSNKLTILAPLFNKAVNEVAKALISDFLAYIGVPDILQSDNGGEFVAEIVESLRLIWSDMKIAIQNAIKIKRTKSLLSNLYVSYSINNQLYQFLLKFLFLHFRYGLTLF